MMLTPPALVPLVSIQLNHPSMELTAIPYSYAMNVQVQSCCCTHHLRSKLRSNLEDMHRTERNGLHMSGFNGFEWFFWGMIASGMAMERTLMEESGSTQRLGYIITSMVQVMASRFPLKVWLCSAFGLHYKCSIPGVVLLHPLYVIVTPCHLQWVLVFALAASLSFAMPPCPRSMRKSTYPAPYFGLRLRVEQAYMNYRAFVSLEAHSALSDKATMLG